MLGECYDVRQGMAENPPVINARLNRTVANRYRIGEGVFVLSAEELEALEFGAVERRHLRPYFEASRLGRYYVPAATDRQILYLTRATAPTLADCPRVAAHLERFRPVLERRRETRLGLCAWWHLHWPREERLFVEPRVLSIQMGRVPQFAWSAQPTFVGFSVNLIVNKLRAAEAAPFSLESLTGILNSTVAAEWFARLAKRRGVSLEISGGLLRQFPLPPADAALDAELASLVRQRQELARRLPDRDAALPAEAQQLETAIERIVARLYA
jgi:adenine-specific DNA-methyltransferase